LWEDRFMSSRDPIEEKGTPQRVAAARGKLESKTTEELFTSALEGGYDDDAPWEAVSVLRQRGTLEVFEAAKRYCESENPKARARGLNVLAQLGAGKPEAERPFMPESVSIAIGHLRDADPDTVSSAAWALSHLGTQPGVAALIGLRSHPSPDVRQAVACCIDLRSHPEGVSILIQLTEDADEVVRDWATFALGSGDVIQGGVWSYPDSPEIRTALRNRLEDTYEEARREAVWGLALRREPYWIEVVA
jgi:HEAT repeat protein